MTRALSAAGSAIAARPGWVAGCTGFAVTFVYVASNAIWYQPHAHRSAFFSTRGAPEVPAAIVPAVELSTLTRFEPVDLPPRAEVTPTPVPARPAMETDETATASLPPQPVPDARQAVVAEVQRILTELKLYSGDIDGLTGPQTNAAVEAYRSKVGLPKEGGIDGAVLKHLGQTEEPAPASFPQPAPEPERPDQIQTASAAPGDARIVKVQAALKAFGNDGIELDGVVGPRTEAAIREFQSLFGLEVTGTASAETIVKMREIGLSD